MRTAQPLHFADRRSLRELLAERYAQQGQRGHSDAADDDLPLHALIDRAKDALTIASENIRGTIPDVSHARAWRKTIQAGALVLAALDTLERRLGDRLPEAADQSDLFPTSQP